jgi:hypothetical protein
MDFALFTDLGRKRATRLEAGLSKFDLGPKYTVQTQLHGFLKHTVFGV